MREIRDKVVYYFTKEKHVHEVVLLIVSFALTLALILMLIRLAPRLGLLDHPDQRKQHDGRVPLVGGLAIYLMLMATILSGLASSVHTIPLLIAATLVTLVGAIDDRNHITPRIRILMQLSVALIMVYGADLRLEQLGPILPNGQQLDLGYLSVAVTIFGIMSVINAMNFIDGLDGLAGGVALIAIAGLWVVFSVVDKPTPDLIPVVMGGMIAFLSFNLRWFRRKKASIFLGDAGSTLLGLLLSWLMVDNTQGSNSVISPVVALWLLAIPLIDFLAVIIRRVTMGRHPFYPDREHLHHIINREVNKDAYTVNIIHISAFTCSAIGVIAQLNSWPMNIFFYIFLGLFAASYVALRSSWTGERLVENE